MKNVNLYNQDGSLCSEAQFLMSFKSSNMSMRDWKKRTKDFKDSLSAEDLKEFERLKIKELNAIQRAKKPKVVEQTEIRKIDLFDENCCLHPEAQFLMYFKSSNLSIGDWKKRTKTFKSQLSVEDLKEFERLRNNAKSKEWREESPEKFKERGKRWREKNSQKAKEDSAKWRKENPEKSKESSAKWYAENTERAKQNDIKWKSKNVEKVREYHRKSKRKPENKLRTAVSKAFKRIRQNKPTDTIALLGCTWEEAKAHIESLFQEGMTWENHGKGEGKWHIDHIRPVASFSGASEEELKQMNHISNLQPLWAIDNIKKGDKWDGELNSEILNSEV